VGGFWVRPKSWVALSAPSRNAKRAIQVGCDC
jgi:hypothetical protein